MFGLSKTEKLEKGEVTNSQIDREFRQQANDRIFELEQRFEALCRHLEVSVRKPYGCTVNKFGIGNNGFFGTPMQAQTGPNISGKTLAEVGAKMESAKKIL